MKDHPVDRERGTSFFPASYWEGDRLTTSAKRTVVERTLDHLDTAQAYTLAIPAQFSGIRQFCLWAAWMAVSTVRELAGADVTGKISRAEVMQIVSFTKTHAGDDQKLDERYSELREAATQALSKLAPST